MRRTTVDTYLSWSSELTEQTERTDLRRILRDTDSYPVLSKIEVYGMEKEVVV